MSVVSEINKEQEETEVKDSDLHAVKPHTDPLIPLPTELSRSQILSQPSPLKKQTKEATSLVLVDNKRSITKDSFIEEENTQIWKTKQKVNPQDSASSIEHLETHAIDQQGVNDLETTNEWIKPSLKIDHHDSSPEDQLAANPLEQISRSSSSVNHWGGESTQDRFGGLLRERGERTPYD